MDAHNDATGVIQVARALALGIPDAELRALAPSIVGLWTALAGLRALPLEGREPVFRPPVRTDDASGGAA